MNHDADVSIGRIEDLEIDNGNPNGRRINLPTDLMVMPKFASLAKLVSQVGACFGCFLGLVIIIAGLGSFQFGILAGIAAIGWGVASIVISLAGLGWTYCFLAIVKAQIDTRNAVIEYTLRK